MSDKLQELLEKFRTDENWNTPNKSGGYRFDEELIWLEGMIRQYAEKFGVTTDQIVDEFESKRNYSWPNYYQPANFPDVSEILPEYIFETVDELKEKTEGFVCPSCKNIGKHPINCDHRIAKDGICDWTAGGLFKLGLVPIIVKSSGYAPIQIFRPIMKGASNEPQV